MAADWKGTTVAGRNGGGGAWLEVSGTIEDTELARRLHD